MAAIDPSAVAQLDEENKVPRATLKIIRVPFDPEDDEDDFEGDSEDMDDFDVIKKRLPPGVAADEDMSSDEEDDSADEKNGGPSDPVKAKKAKEAALSKKLKEELDEMELDGLANGVDGKGKGKALDLDDDEDDSELDSEDEVEQFVICTLEPEKVSSLKMSIPDTS